MSNFILIRSMSLSDWDQCLFSSSGVLLGRDSGTPEVLFPADQEDPYPVQPSQREVRGLGQSEWSLVPVIALRPPRSRRSSGGSSIWLLILLRYSRYRYAQLKWIHQRISDSWWLDIDLIWSLCWLLRQPLANRSHGNSPVANEGGQGAEEYFEQRMSDVGGVTVGKVIQHHHQARHDHTQSAAHPGKLPDNSVWMIFLF